MNKTTALKGKWIVAVLILSLAAACDDDDNNNIPGSSDIYDKAFPSKFTFVEMDTRNQDYAAEANDGAVKIELNLPYGTTDLMLTPEESNFNSEDFEISPDPSVTQDFSEKVMYTLTSKERPEIKVTYEVIATVSDDPQDAVNLTWGLLLDFALEEVEYDDITVNFPQWEEGTEVQPGTIVVTLPEGTSDLTLTPKESNYQDKKGFTISPAMGQQTDFSEAVTYTIQVNNTERKMHFVIFVEVANNEDEG